MKKFKLLFVAILAMFAFAGVAGASFSGSLVSPTEAATATNEVSGNVIAIVATVTGLAGYLITKSFGNRIISAIIGFFKH